MLKYFVFQVYSRTYAPSDTGGGERGEDNTLYVKRRTAKRMS